MKIRKRDQDINLYMCLLERENPERFKARRSSNKVFLLCALLVGGMMILLMVLWNRNFRIKEEIEINESYITNAQNIEIYNRKNMILKKIEEIESYNLDSETYLGQLQNSARFSSRWVDFFEREMVNAIGSGGKIQSFGLSENILKVDCVSLNAEQPKIFAKHLSKMKNEKGENLFADVKYTGFSKQSDGYFFVLMITLWEKPNAQIN